MGSICNTGLLQIASISGSCAHHNVDAERYICNLRQLRRASDPYRPIACCIYQYLFYGSCCTVCIYIYVLQALDSFLENASLELESVMAAKVEAQTDSQRVVVGTLVFGGKGVEYPPAWASKPQVAFQKADQKAVMIFFRETHENSVYRISEQGTEAPGFTSDDWSKGVPSTTTNTVGPDGLPLWLEVDGILGVIPKGKRAKVIVVNKASRICICRLCMIANSMRCLLILWWWCGCM